MVLQLSSSKPLADVCIQPFNDRRSDIMTPHQGDSKLVMAEFVLINAIYASTSFVFLFAQEETHYRSNNASKVQG